ncbi:MAG TPA: hypothetical protein VMM92_01075, partial [Thermoanaerobaculia bacterium]|nr:hypothetical protein [Thermoanaerobaculia bacterium]
VDQNTLLGDYLYVNGTTPSQGFTMVHLQADPNDPETSTSGKYTFYGRYVNWTAIDHRQRLPSRFFARYLTGGSNSTTMTAWRDSKTAQQAFPCGTPPSWYPLGQARVVAFDEQEHVAESAVPIFPFGAQVQQTAVGGTSLPTPFSFGWILYDLNATAGSVPPDAPLGDQAWMSLSMTSGGSNVAFPAFPLDDCHTGSLAAGPASFHSLAPCRLLDTRTTNGPAIAAHTARRFVAAGRCGVPATARAIAVNLSAIGASSGGDLRLFAADAQVPFASAINFAAHQTRSNNAILPVSAGGEVGIWSDQPLAATVHLTVDVNGYFE